MFFKKKRKKVSPRNPNVIAVNKIIIGFLLAAYVANAIQHHSLSPLQNAAEIKQSILKAAPEIPAGFVDYNNFFPASPAEITIKDEQPGEGTPAVCGQDATIAYSATTTSAKLLSDKADKDKPLIFRIGDHKVIPALEQGVVGLAKGGRRIITAPPASAYDSKDFARDGIAKNITVLFDVILLDIKPTLPDLKDSPFRISDEQQGMGHPILCSTSAKVHVTLWDMTGKKLFSTHDKGDKPLVFTPGKSEVFLGLEQGVIGMNVRGKRSMIVPPSFQKTMRGNAPIIEFPFPPQQTVLVEVEAMP